MASLNRHVSNKDNGVTEGAPKGSLSCRYQYRIGHLLSLMVHQVSSQRVRGVRAAIMSGHKGVDEKELLAADSDVEAGKYNLLFCAPEAAEWKICQYGI